LSSAYVPPAKSDVKASSPVEMLDQPVRGRPRCNEKNHAILNSAATLFLENGFDGTSMDAVAKDAGVSKQTVYSHFASKETLFGEAVRAKIHNFSPDAALETMSEHTLEGDLRALTQNYVNLMLNHESIALMRLLAGAANKGNKLAEIFYEVSSSEILDRISDFFQTWAGKGELKIDDPKIATGQFLSLLKGEYHFRWMMGQIDGVSDTELAQHVDRVTDVFLKIYRT